MSLLGSFILSSLVFVFAAMAEFAFILFLNQKEVWKNIKENRRSDEANSQKMRRTWHHGGTIARNDVISETTEVRTLKETEENEIRNTHFWSKKYNMLSDLPYTTKIDLAGFILFHLIYLIFNIVYWVNVVNLFYHNN